MAITERATAIPERGNPNGEGPDYWPVFLTHGPTGGGAVSVWDFTEAMKC